MITMLSFFLGIAAGHGPAHLGRVTDPRSDVPGAYVQRTMRLLAESTREHPNSVRVLFYGQSITGQPWWQQVVNDLRKRFPSANLVVENRAIGGFAANLLKRIEPIDVPPFQPDLVIFHDYGGEPDYEEMVRNIRRQTTAEVLLQTDHLDSVPGSNATADERRRYEWHNAHADWLKRLGDDLRCGVVDVRGAWREHLARTGLEPKALLIDGVHLNEAGMDLMARLVGGFLVRDPKQPDGVPSEAIRTYRVGAGARWREGKIILRFEGNRVDVVPKTGVKAEFLIDGKRPSEFPGCYTFCRPTNAFGAWFPALIGIRSNTMPILEDWTATLTKPSTGGSQFGFVLQGSKTGADGIGESGKPFRSESGRIVIDPEDWAVQYGASVSRQDPPDRFEVRWRVLPMFRDSLAKSDGPVTVAQGLPNGTHTLEILVNDPEGIDQIRTYKPPQL